MENTKVASDRELLHYAIGYLKGTLSPVPGCHRTPAQRVNHSLEFIEKLVQAEKDLRATGTAEI